MSTVFRVGQGNTRVLYATLTEADGVTPLTSGLAGCVVTLIMRDPNTLTPVLTAGAVIDDTVACNVHYSFTATDTASAGTFVAAWKVAFPNGQSISVPDGAYFSVEIAPAVDSPTYPNPAGTSALDLLEEVRHHISGPQRAILNVLNANLDRAQTTLQLAVDVLVNPGDRISAGLETMYVVSYAMGTRIVTVIRGADNSPTTLHLAGEMLRINARFTNYRIFRALNSALGQLSSDGLWWAKQVFRTADPISLTYNLAGDLIGKQILQIAYNRPGGQKQWTEIRDFDVFPSVDHAQYASGVAVQINHPMSQGQQVRFTYKANLGVLVSLADDVQLATGIPSTALDLPPLAAAVALLAGAPVQRSDTRAQGTTRRAEEVSTSDTIQGSAALRARYAQRVMQEASSLAQQWPTKRRMRSLL